MAKTFADSELFIIKEIMHRLMAIGPHTENNRINRVDPSNTAFISMFSQTLNDLWYEMQSVRINVAVTEYRGLRGIDKSDTQNYWNRQLSNATHGQLGSLSEVGRTTCSFLLYNDPQTTSWSSSLRSLVATAPWTCLPTWFPSSLLAQERNVWGKDASNWRSSIRVWVRGRT